MQSLKSYRCDGDNRNYCGFAHRSSTCRKWFCCWGRPCRIRCWSYRWERTHAATGVRRSATAARLLRATAPCLLWATPISRLPTLLTRLASPGELYVFELRRKVMPDSQERVGVSAVSPSSSFHAIRQFASSLRECALIFRHVGLGTQCGDHERDLRFEHVEYHRTARYCLLAARLHDQNKRIVLVGRRD